MIGINQLLFTCRIANLLVLLADVVFVAKGTFAVAAIFRPVIRRTKGS